MAQLRIQAIPLATLSSALISNTYTPVNGTGLPNACFLLRIINNSTEPVTLSYGGSTDSDILPAGDTLQLPGPINTNQGSRGALFPIGTIIYARGTAGTGSIGVAGYFTLQP